MTSVPVRLGEAAAAAETLWAHHAALVAIPAFVPAIVVVAVVLHIARKDRRDEREEEEVLRRALDDDPQEPSGPRPATRPDEETP